MTRPTKDERALTDQIRRIEARIKDNRRKIMDYQCAIDEAWVIRDQLAQAIIELRRAQEARRNAKNT